MQDRGPELSPAAPSMQLAQQLLLLRLLVAGLTSSSVPPVGPDGSCAAFRPLPEPTSLAAARPWAGT